MTQYEGNYPAYDVEPRARRWPLAGVFFIDFVIILVAVLVLTTMISVGFLVGRSMQQGISLFTENGIDQETLLRLIGADGIFLTMLLQNAVFVAVPVVRLRLLRREPLATIGFRATHMVRLLAYGIGIGVVTLLSNAAFGALFQYLGVEQNQADQYPLFQGDYFGQGLFFIAAAILAPIGEEVLFRGYAFNAFLQSWSKYRWGTLAAFGLSAFLFMIVHSFAATQDVIGLLVPAFVMGLLFAWAMYRTGSLIPCIIAHAMNNAVGVLALTYCINNPTICPNF